ncbi:type II toxin-antitoxin system HigB family toxin [Hymenobacter sp.]|uniref:type II toxin-antitoxin system HigB family toxin n=1 Tax=Hymenobacter sp. TaxID=1898978 RepID=UPI002D8063EA|nr:type II toxin-antitoxin system HigB family toxin [Hymenobacter sp.]
MSYAALRDFIKTYPDSASGLEDWYRKTKVADWKNLSELRQTFNSADYVGNERVVFNISGNRYRLIASVLYSIRTVFIKFIGTHTAYDAVDSSTVEHLKK